MFGQLVRSKCVNVNGRFCKLELDIGVLDRLRCCRVGGSAEIVLNEVTLDRFKVFNDCGNSSSPNSDTLVPERSNSLTNNTLVYVKLR